MIRKAPHTLEHGATTVIVGAGVDSLTPASIALGLLATVTGAPIDSGTCDGCHVRYKANGGTVEEWENPAFSGAAQILTKAGIMLSGGVIFALLFGGRIATVVGLVGANLLARPIVNTIARGSGPESPPPTGAEILPSQSASQAALDAAKAKGAA